MDPSTTNQPRETQIAGRRVGFFVCWVVVGIVFAFGTGEFVLANEPVTAAGTADQSAPDAPAAPTEAPNPPVQEDVSLDALLDLADQAPEQLKAIGVKDSPNDLMLSPEMVFNPDTDATSPANSTGGLLSFAPGVIIRSTSALNHDARIRGYSGSQLVGIANGMNQVKTRLDIDSLFSQVDPQLVESIAVIPGPYSVEYGPGFAFFDAQLIAPQRADEPTFSSHSTFGFNTNGRQLMWRETAGFADRHSGAIVSFGQRMGNDYQPGAHSTDFRVPASYHVQDVYTAISNDVGEFGRFDASYLHQSLQDTELPGVAYDINQQNADQFNLRFTQRDQFTNAERLQLQFWWNQAAYNGDASRPSKQITFVERLLGEPFPDMAGGGTLTGHGMSDNWGTRAIASWGDNETWQVRTGADWRRIRQFYRERDFQASGAPEFDDDVFGIPDSAADDFGLFVNGNLVVNERWSVAAGQRLDWVWYDVDSSDSVVTTVQGTPNGEYYPGLGTSTRVLSLTYLTGSFRATENLTLTAGAAYAMRPPNLTELYSDQPFAPLVRFGNSYAFGDSELDSEQNLQFDLGATSKHDQTTVGARAFYSTIHDYIGLAPTSFGSFPDIGTVPPGQLGRGQPFLFDPAFPTQDIYADSSSMGYIYRNIDRATLYGFDLLGERQVAPWLELAGTLTYTEGINHDPKYVDVYTGEVQQVSSREGLPGIYPISALTTFRLVEPETRKWTLEWQSRFVGKQGHLATSLSEIGTPGFGVHNINASYRWSDRISLRSSLLNVFNRNYYEHNSLAIVDRNGNIGFVKNPGISWFFSLDATY